MWLNLNCVIAGRCCSLGVVGCVFDQSALLVVVWFCEVEVLFEWYSVEGETPVGVSKICH